MIRGKIKAILPLILSVAMTIQSAPVTAFAAPADVDIAEEAIEEIAVEEDEAVVDEEILDEAIEEEVVETADEVLTGEGELTGTIVLEQTRATQFTYAGRKYIYDGKSGLSGSYPDGENLDDIFRGLNDGWDYFVERISVKLSDKRTSSFYAWDKQTVEYYKSDKTTKLTAAEQADPDAGKYFVKVTAEITGATIAEPLFIPFDINKDDAQIYIESHGSVQSGLEASKFIEEIKNYLYIESSSFDDALNMFASSINVSIKQDGKEYTGIVADDGSEYVVTVSAVLKDDYAKNYNPVAATVVVDADWFKSPISVTPSVEYKKPAGAKEEDPTPTFIEVDYTGSEIAAPITLPSLSNNSVEVKFEYRDTETGKDVAVPINKDNLEGIWLDDNGDELAKDEKVIDAGTYYYRVSFEDSTKKFDTASVDIEVHVKPIKLYLKPVVKAYTFFEDMRAYNVLNHVDYELYTDEDCTKKAENIDRNTFWGTTYSNIGIAQPFVPTFKLQEVTTYKKYSELTADEKKALVWSDIASNMAALVATDVKDEDTEKYTYYRVASDGRKKAYDANGDESRNGALKPEDKNYTVDTTPCDATEVKINKSANIKIDISKIIDAAIDPKKGDTVANRKVKTYDGKMLYDKRADYKLATVSENAAKNGIIEYEWYQYGYVDTETVDGKEVEVYRYPTPVSYDYNYYAPSPKDAGYYGLQVNYYDPTGEFVAPTEEIFFEIKPQSVVVSPKEPIKVKAKTPTSNVLDGREYDIFAVSGNSIAAEPLKGLAADNFSKDIKYCDVAADKADISKYNDYSSYEFEYADNRTYKAVNLGFDVYDSITGEDLSNNYSYSYETKDGDKYTSDLKPIEIVVEKIGDKVLTLNADASKLNKVYDGQPIDIAAGIKIVDSEGKPASVQPVYTWYNNDFDGNTQVTNLTPVDAGDYGLYVLYEGDATYDRLEEYVGTFTISPKELKPNIVVDVPAGVKAATDYWGTATVAYYAYVQEPVEGIVEKDKDKVGINLNENVGKVFVNGKQYKSSDSYLVYNTDYEYEANLETTILTKEEFDLNGNHYGPWDGSYNKDTGLYYNPADNYYFDIVRTVPFKVVKRGSSNLSKMSRYADFTDERDGLIHTVKPNTAIDFVHKLYDRYSDDVKDENGDDYNGNYFAFRITKPNEYKAYDSDCGVDNKKYFTNNFLFKNSIKAAGGVLLDIDNDFIQVAFDAAKGNKEFAIEWEKGYTETFKLDFTNIPLGIDKKLAVAPKSLAFNNPAKTMAVGESQSLDVKYTKELYKDVVILNYKAETDNDRKVLAVDETTGRVTALKKGKATVEVYPVRANEKGKLVKIEGAKTAKVTITVKDVDMPKISKVTPSDDEFKLVYNKVSNGYRREIYVAEGKKTVDFFENELLTIKNNNFDDSEIIEVQYYSNDRGKGKIDPPLTINGLLPNTEYTVYVRNVSGLRREGPDKIWVADSHVGNVKTFKTTKPNAVNLYVDLSKDPNVSVDSSGYNFAVPYSAGKAKMDIYAEFPAEYRYADADYGDVITTLLPSSDRDLKNTYNMPKLKATAYSYYNGPKDFAISKIVKIDAKGNITLKGVGFALVVIEDTVSGVATGFFIESYAVPTKITAKNVKLRVGEDVYLTENDFLTYYVGSKKVIVDGGMFRESYYAVTTSTDKGNEAYFTIEDGTGDIDDQYDEDRILAVGEGAIGKKVKVVLEDHLYPNGNLDTSKISTEFNVDTTSLTKVSDLKVVDVVDYTGQVTFTYPDIDVDFKVDLEDARGNLEASKICDLSGDAFDETDDEELYRWDYDYKYNKAKKCYEFNFNINTVFGGEIAEYYDGRCLSRKTNYKITVTPVRKLNRSGVSTDAKLYSGTPASVKFKTTDIPASYEVLGPGEKGGMSIYRVNSNYNYNYYYYYNTPISNGYSIKSGNQIILKPKVTYGAEYAGSDVLTWTVDNKKVATVKANPGTNTVTITAVSAGDFTLSVKSKITGKTVARYDLKVSPVQDADSYQGGESSWLDYDELN